MDITKIDEQWYEIQRIHTNNQSIAALSNTGKYRRVDGSEGILDLRHKVQHKGTKQLAYRIIAEHFLITVKRPDQNQIDHITHHPMEYNVNDVRNLRYCTQTENTNFDEAKENGKFCKIGKKNPMYGKTGENSPMWGRTGDKHPHWKGDSVGPVGRYKRAKKLYKAGKITEEELQPYRDEIAEYYRNKRKPSNSRRS
jgi:hypothetical protein